MKINNKHFTTIPYAKNTSEKFTKYNENIQKYLDGNTHCAQNSNILLRLIDNSL